MTGGAFRRRLAAAWQAAKRSFVRRRQARVKCRFVEFVPARLGAGILYVTTGSAGPAFGSMLCPCGCRDALQLRFLPGRHPTWSLSGDQQNPTIKPSIWRTKNCGSHFYLTSGRVNWCRSNYGVHS